MDYDSYPIFEIYITTANIYRHRDNSLNTEQKKKCAAATRFFLGENWYANGNANNFVHFPE